MKTLEELRKLAENNLLEELMEYKKLLFKVKFEVENAQSKNHHHIKNYRKYIAKIQTLLRENKKQESNKK